MNSLLYLCQNVELDPNYNYTLDFDTETEQLAYFSSKVANVIDTDNYTYIRDDNSIKVDANIDSLFGINYLYYKNKDKYYFAFITHKEYVSTSTTRINFDIDVMQTFMFDYTVEHSFIEREHQDRWKAEGNSLKAKRNLIKENLNYGEDYINTYRNLNITQPIDGAVSKVSLIFTYAFLKSTDNVSSRTQENGIMLGYDVYMNIGKYYDNPLDSGNTPKIYWKLGTDKKEFETQEEFIKRYAKDPQVAQILVSKIPPCQMIYKVTDKEISIEAREPFLFITDAVPADGKFNQYIRERWNYDNHSIVGLGDLLTKPEDLIDKNELNINNPVNERFETKLQTYPYYFNKYIFGNSELLLKNEMGLGSLAFFQSLSSEGSSTVFPYGTYLTDGSVISYKNQHSAMNLTPNFVDLHTTEWEKYMLENKNQRMAGFNNAGITAGLGAMGALGAAFSGHPVAAIASLVGTGANAYQRISSQLAKEEDIKNQPDDVRQFIGDTSMNMIVSDLSVREVHCEILPVFKHRLFNYFMHYGYAVNDFKKPDLRSRYYYNYIKTIDANIKTNIDSTYKKQIADIFDKGITIFHCRDAATFKGINNYDYENVEMSLLEV